MVRSEGLPYFPFPFAPTLDWYEDDRRHPPRTLKEQLICRVMGAVMRKPEWMRKVNDEGIVAQWKKELRQMAVPEDFPLQIDDDIINYAIAELQWMSATHRGGPVEPSPVDGVFQILNAIPIVEGAGAQAPLLDAVRKMEDVPEDEVDYHPGSDGQVIDLVHPSMYCLVYGLTRILEESESLDAVPSWDQIVTRVAEQPAALPGNLLTEDGEFVSTKFQWLPAEIDVFSSKDGGTPGARFRSYINNINPRLFPELYPALASIFAVCFVPLFEKVLTKLVNPTPLRLEVDCHRWYDNWKGEREYDMDDGTDWQQWYDDRQPVQPEVPAFQPPPEVPEESQIKLSGRRLQVIVKIAEIRLTPEKPAYPGGTWHVEGMKNEAIVATGIYYFSVDNIKNSELAFRKSVDEPEYEQYDKKGTKQIYGLGRDEPLVQSLGSVPTSLEGLCLAFPNLYHHWVSPFSLADHTKPGHRKILAFFLVDPGQRVVSTARVPPQQASWRHVELERSQHPCSVLPAPAREDVGRRLSEALGAMDVELAKDVRLQLMMERKILLDKATEEVLERPFNLCEH